jgi:hypothetical protein
MDHRIKVLSDKSQYFVTNNQKLIRNFINQNHGYDLNNLYSAQDIKSVIINEGSIKTMNLSGIDKENKFSATVAIVSDGFDIAKCENLINNLGRLGITVIGTNGCMTCKSRVIPSVYLFNSVDNVSSWFPNTLQVLPPCIVSVRSNPEFVKKYRSRNKLMYTYVPTPNKNFGSNYFNSFYTVDDYRNPICAGINLAFRWQASRIILIAPHDLFSEERPGTKKIAQNIHIYPQQELAHSFIDGSLYWIKEAGIETWVISSGPKFEFATNFEPEQVIEKLMEGQVGKRTKRQ